MSDTVTIPRAEYEALRRRAKEATRLRAEVRLRRPHPPRMDREARRGNAARMVIEASEALAQGAEAIALATRLGFVSADAMVDAVLEWRRNSGRG